MTRRLLTHLAILVWLVVATEYCRSTEIVFNDSMFDDSSWAMTPVVGPQDAQVAFQIQSDGNPGQCRQVNTLVHDLTFYAHMKTDTGFVIDPAMNPINWVQYAIDFESIVARHHLSWVLEQDGTYFRPEEYTSQHAAHWTSFSSPSLVESDFGQINPSGDVIFDNSPDFGITGSPIRFGFLTGNSFGSGVMVKYDNFEVKVDFEGDLILPGDMNGDGYVNGLDVDPFVHAVLSNPFNLLGDMNGDGVVTGLDIDPFVAALLGRGMQPIPEPSTLLLALLALSITGALRKWGV